MQHQECQFTGAQLRAGEPGAPKALLGLYAHAHPTICCAPFAVARRLLLLISTYSGSLPCHLACMVGSRAAGTR